MAVHVGARVAALAVTAELELRLVNYRETTPLRAGQVDDPERREGQPPGEGRQVQLPEPELAEPAAAGLDSGGGTL